MFIVEINWFGEWIRLARYTTRDNAEWAIARWRGAHGSNHLDMGFRVYEDPAAAPEPRGIRTKKGGER